MKMTFSSRTATLVNAILLLIVVSGLSVNADQTEAERLVQPTDDGRVTGRVYDAATLTPIPGAAVIVQQDKAFADSGKTVGKTDANGMYECKARIGRISSHLNLAGALFSSPLGLLTGSARDKTRRTDVSRLNIKVTASGFRPFGGIVPCRRIIADEFVAAMEPIMLVKADSREVSSVATGWGNMEIVNASIEPAILHPKWKATMTVRLKCPIRDAKVKPTIIVYSGLCGKKQLRKPTAEPDGTMLFKAEWAVPTGADGIDLMRLTVHDTPYELRPQNDVVLLQVFKGDAKEKAAQLRLQAFELRQKRQYDEALNVLRELCSMSEAIDYDRDTLCSIQDLIAARSSGSAAETPPSDTDLDLLISAARKETETDQKFQDFGSWHRYALLLFRRAHVHCQRNSAEIPASIEECRNALIGALRSGRSTKTSKSTNLAFGGRMIHSASGFQSPEADSDFILLQNLDVLSNPQPDYLSYLNVATALCELSEMDLASSYASRCLDAKPDCIEAKYIRAVADLHLSRHKEGIQLLEEVVKASPRHPQAAILLAAVLIKAGKVEKAEPLLNDYGQFYGCDARAAMDSVSVPATSTEAEPEKSVSPPVTQAPAMAPEIPPSEPVLVTGPRYLTIAGANLVQLKAIADWLGASVDFDRGSGVVTLKVAEHTVSLKLNGKTASIDGKLVELQTPATERDGIAFVPLRVVSQAFGAKVRWDAGTHTIQVTHPAKSEVLVLSKQ